MTPAASASIAVGPRAKARASVRRHPAFTLVELLLVLVIIAVFAGTAAVSLKGRRDERAVRSGAADVCAAIRYALHTTAAKGQPHCLTLDQATGAFHVEVWDEEVQEYHPAAGLPGRPRKLPERVHIARVVRSDDLATPPPVQRPAPGSSSSAAQSPVPTEPLPERLEFGRGDDFAGVLDLVSVGGDAARVRVLPRGGQVYVER